MNQYVYIVLQKCVLLQNSLLSTTIPSYIHVQFLGLQVLDTIYVNTHTINSYAVT